MKKIKDIKKLLVNDIQLHQNINLILIVLISKIVFDIPIEWLEILFVWLTVILSELFFMKIFKVKKNNIFSSAINTWVWIILFLKTWNILLYWLAAFLSIASKYIFNIKWKHYLNPSNVWLILVLVLFPSYTWVVPEQWWLNYYFYFLILILALVILYRISSIKILIWFLLSFIFFHYLLISPSFDLLYTKIFNIWFLIFASFMLTDPRIYPKWVNKFLYWISIWTMYWILLLFIDTNYTILLSLFVITLAFYLKDLFNNLLSFDLKNNNFFYIIYSLILFSTVFLNFTDKNYLANTDYIKKNIEDKNINLHASNVESNWDSKVIKTKDNYKEFTFLERKNFHWIWNNSKINRHKYKKYWF